MMNSSHFDRCLTIFIVKAVLFSMTLWEQNFSEVITKIYFQFQGIKFENVACKMAVILSRPRFVSHEPEINAEWASIPWVNSTHQTGLCRFSVMVNGQLFHCGLTRCQHVMNSHINRNMRQLYYWPCVVEINNMLSLSWISELRRWYKYITYNICSMLSLKWISVLRRWYKYITYNICNMLSLKLIFELRQWYTSHAIYVYIYMLRYMSICHIRYRVPQ